jgi:hypothetical protein
MYNSVADYVTYSIYKLILDHLKQTEALRIVRINCQRIT